MSIKLAPNQIETKILNFGGGISDDPRELALNKYQIAKHFDSATNPKKLIPYRSVETETLAGVGNFLYNSSGELCALAKDGSNAWGAIYYKSGSGIVTDAWVGGRWAGTKGVVQYPLFVEFNGKIYFCEFDTPNYDLVSALIANPYTVDENIGHLTDSVGAAVPTGNGFVHPKTNTLFIPVGNQIAKVTSAGAFTADSAPDIASNLEIVSLTEWGSYLAIGCRDKAMGNSKIIIWDMVSTTTFIDIIDFGRDSLYVLNNLEGYLIGVSCTSNTLFTGDYARLTIQIWGGGKPTLIKEILAKKLRSGTPTVTIYPEVNFIQQNKLYFAAKISGGTSPSPTHIGIWTIGRKNASYPFALNFDRFVTNDNSETSIEAGIMMGDYFWAVHTVVGTMTRTDDQQSYLATSIYESQVFNGELHGLDSSFTKKLVGVSVQHDKLPAEATVILKYRADGATSWTTIFTNETDDSLSHEAINISGVAFPQYKEIEFRIEFYGGTAAVGSYGITGFSWKEEIIDKKLY